MNFLKQVGNLLLDSDSESDEDDTAEKKRTAKERKKEGGKEADADDAGDADDADDSESDDEPLIPDAVWQGPLVPCSPNPSQHHDRCRGARLSHDTVSSAPLTPTTNRLNRKHPPTCLPRVCRAMHTAVKRASHRERRMRRTMMMLCCGGDHSSRGALATAKGKIAEVGWRPERGTKKND